MLWALLTALWLAGAAALSCQEANATYLGSLGFAVAPTPQAQGWLTLTNQFRRFWCYELNLDSFDNLGSEIIIQNADDPIQMLPTTPFWYNGQAQWDSSSGKVIARETANRNDVIRAVAQGYQETYVPLSDPQLANLASDMLVGVFMDFNEVFPSEPIPRSGCDYGVSTRFTFESGPTNFTSFDLLYPYNCLEYPANYSTLVCSTDSYFGGAYPPDSTFDFGVAAPLHGSWTYWTQYLGPALFGQNGTSLAVARVMWKALRLAADLHPAGVHAQDITQFVQESCLVLAVDLGLNLQANSTGLLLDIPQCTALNTELSSVREYTTPSAWDPSDCAQYPEATWYLEDGFEIPLFYNLQDEEYAAGQFEGLDPPIPVVLQMAVKQGDLVLYRVGNVENNCTVLADAPYATCNVYVPLFQAQDVPDTANRAFLVQFSVDGGATWWNPTNQANVTIVYYRPPIFTNLTPRLLNRTEGPWEVSATGRHLTTNFTTSLQAWIHNVGDTVPYVQSVGVTEISDTLMNFTIPYPLVGSLDLSEPLFITVGWALNELYPSEITYVTIVPPISFLKLGTKLSALSVSFCDTFTPAFDPNVYQYTCEVPYDRTQMGENDVTATPQFTEVDVVISTAPGFIQTEPVNNTIGVFVSADDSLSAYFVDVVRVRDPGNFDVFLLSLEFQVSRDGWETVETCDIDVETCLELSGCDCVVDHFVSKYRILAIPSDPDNVTVSAAQDGSSVEGSVDISVGTNEPVYVFVTLKTGGTTGLYTINLYRENNDLARFGSINIPFCDINPPFDPEVFEYTCGDGVVYADRLDVFATPLRFWTVMLAIGSSGLIVHTPGPYTPWSYPGATSYLQHLQTLINPNTDEVNITLTLRATAVDEDDRITVLDTQDYVFEWLWITDDAFPTLDYCNFTQPPRHHVYRAIGFAGAQLRQYIPFNPSADGTLPPFNGTHVNAWFADPGLEYQYGDPVTGVEYIYNQSTIDVFWWAQTTAMIMSWISDAPYTFNQAFYDIDGPSNQQVVFSCRPIGSGGFAIVDYELHYEMDAGNLLEGWVARSAATPLSILTPDCEVQQERFFPPFYNDTMTGQPMLPPEAYIDEPLHIEVLCVRSNASDLNFTVFENDDSFAGISRSLAYNGEPMCHNSLGDPLEPFELPITNNSLLAINEYNFTTGIYSRVGGTISTCANGTISRNASVLVTVKAEQNVSSINNIVEAAILNQLDAPACTIFPPFSPLIFAYTCFVDASVTHVTVSANATHPGVVITADTNVPLTPGVEVTVTANCTVPDHISGLPKTYSFFIERLESNNTNVALVQVSSSEGLCINSTNATQTDYTCNVGFDVSEVTILVEGADPDAQLVSPYDVEHTYTNMTHGENIFSYSILSGDQQHVQLVSILVVRAFDAAYFLDVVLDGCPIVFNTYTTYYLCPNNASVSIGTQWNITYTTLATSAITTVEITGDVAIGGLNRITLAITSPLAVGGFGTTRLYVFDIYNDVTPSYPGLAPSQLISDIAATGCAFPIDTEVDAAISQNQTQLWCEFPSTQTSTTVSATALGGSTVTITPSATQTGIPRAQAATFTITAELAPNNYSFVLYTFRSGGNSAALTALSFTNCSFSFTSNVLDYDCTFTTADSTLEYEYTTEDVDAQVIVTASPHEGPFRSQVVSFQVTSADRTVRETYRVNTTHPLRSEVNITDIRVLPLCDEGDLVPVAENGNPLPPVENTFQIRRYFDCTVPASSSVMVLDVFTNPETANFAVTNRDALAPGSVPVDLVVSSEDSSVSIPKRIYVMQPVNATQQSCYVMRFNISYCGYISPRLTNDNDFGTCQHDIPGHVENWDFTNTELADPGATISSTPLTNGTNNSTITVTSSDTNTTCVYTLQYTQEASPMTGANATISLFIHTAPAGFLPASCLDPFGTECVVPHNVTHACVTVTTEDPMADVASSTNRGLCGEQPNLALAVNVTTQLIFNVTAEGASNTTATEEYIVSFFRESSGGGGGGGGGIGGGAIAGIVVGSIAMLMFFASAGYFMKGAPVNVADQDRLMVVR